LRGLGGRQNGTSLLVSEQPMITFAVHQVRAGPAGASEDFEQMLGLLVRATCGEANLVFANPGDWALTFWSVIWAGG
jgi:hypothetical protein